MQGTQSIKRSEAMPNKKRSRCPETEDNSTSNGPPRKKQKLPSINGDTKEEESDELHFLSNYIASTITIQRIKDNQRFDDDGTDESRKLKFNVLKPQTTPKPTDKKANKERKLILSPNWVRLSDIFSNAFKYNTSTEPTPNETKKQFITALQLFLKRNCVKHPLDTFYTSFRGRYYISEKAFCILLVIMKDFDAVSHHVEHFCHYRFYYRGELFGTKIGSFNAKKNPQSMDDIMICTRCCLEDIEENFFMDNPCDCNCILHIKCNDIHHGKIPKESDDWFCAFCVELSLDQLKERRRNFNENGEFEVEKVIDYDEIDNEYIVKWRHYPDDACCNTQLSFSFIESVDSYWKQNRDNIPSLAQKAINILKEEINCDQESETEKKNDTFIPTKLSDVMDEKYIIRRQKYTKETYQRMKETQDKHRKWLLKQIKTETVIGMELKREMAQTKSNRLPKYHLQSVNNKDWDCDLPRIHDIIISFLKRDWKSVSFGDVSCDSFVIGDIIDLENPAKKYGGDCGVHSSRAFGLFAVKDIKKDTLLFEYSGCVKPIGLASKALDNLETELDQTTLFDLIGHLDSDRTKLFWGKKPNDQLVIDPSKWHNEGVYMNDYRDRVMDDPDDDDIVCDNNNINSDRKQNVKFYEVLVNNWPRVFAVALCDINIGQELLGDYGADFWSNFRLMMIRQKQLKDIKDRINNEWQIKYDELMQNYKKTQNKNSTK